MIDNQGQTTHTENREPSNNQQRPTKNKYSLTTRTSNGMEANPVAS